MAGVYRNNWLLHQILNQEDSRFRKNSISFPMVGLLPELSWWLSSGYNTRHPPGILTRTKGLYSNYAGWVLSSEISLQYRQIGSFQMAQWLRTLAILSNAPCSIPSRQMATYNSSCNSSPRISNNLSWPQRKGTCIVHRRIDRHNFHRYNKIIFWNVELRATQHYE